MPMLLFQFSRKLRISRFTIDVLLERVTHLHPPSSRVDDEWRRTVGRTCEDVKMCDRLHQELGDQFATVRTPDAGAFSSLSGQFEDLHRRIAESIATLNSFENKTPYTH